jgi:hypothetical protein
MVQPGLEALLIGLRLCDLALVSHDAADRDLALGQGIGNGRAGRGHRRGT